MTATLFSTVGAGWTLGLRSIRLQIREHALGYAWTLIIPVLYAICYIFITRELAGDAVSTGPDLSWSVLRAFTGITLFQCWIQILQDIADLIRRQRSVLRGLNTGVMPFVLAIVFEGGLSMAVRVLLIVSAFPVLGLALPDGIAPWLWFVLCLLSLHLTSIALGMLLAPWAALYADVRKALGSIALPLVLASPIFYPAVENTDSALYWLNALNPLASPLAVISDALRGGISIYIGPMLIWMVLSLLLVLWSGLQLRRQVPVLLERLGN